MNFYTKHMCLVIVAIMVFSILAGCANMTNMYGTEPTRGETAMTETTQAQTLIGSVSYDQSKQTALIENERISLSLDLRHGISVSSIKDKVLNHDYLNVGLFDKGSYLFEYKTGIGGSYCHDISVNNVDVTDESLYITATNSTGNLQFQVELTSTELNTVSVAMAIKNTGNNSEHVMVVFPRIEGLVTPGSSAAQACIPQEIGWTGDFEGYTYGMGIVPEYGLPGGMNAMEVACVYAEDGTGGIFFADVSGEADSEIWPLAFRIDNKVVGGYWVKQVEPGSAEVAPMIAIGVIQNGDWHQAVDYYIEKHQARKNTFEVPTWFRECGGVYCADRTSTGGAIYLSYTDDKDLASVIDSFEELPKILKKAEKCGTNVIYLVDYYERADISDVPNRELTPPDKFNIYQYSAWNKGNYVPRSDLGGADALINGIKAVHDQGGKVILYVEPYIIFKYSELGKEIGEEWAARNNISGELLEDFTWCYTMCSAYKPWQDYIVEICRRLVEDYGADGIMLDSWGWRWNQSYFNSAEGITYTSEDISRGVLELNDMVREMVRSINPEAVVISESGSGPFIYHNDGGFTADYCWAQSGNGVLLSSPTKYGLPHANLFSGGLSMNAMNQIYAAGFGFQLSDFWLSSSKEIKPLLDIRREYKDALIYGDQAYQPATDSECVAAYYYQGSENAVVTVVNAGDEKVEGSIELRVDEANTVWTDLISGNTYATDKDGIIQIQMKKHTLLVLKKEK